MDDFHDLYQKYVRHVYRFALFLSGDSSMADDITSETFVRALTAHGRIRDATVKAYLFTIARNIYRDIQQRNARYTEIDESMADPSLSLLSYMEQREEADDVLAVLQELPPVDRTALLLRVQEEMSYEQIAQALGLTPITARVKVHRARLKLLRARVASREVRS